jgi:hypothetical protein
MRFFGLSVCPMIFAFIRRYVDRISMRSQFDSIDFATVHNRLTLKAGFVSNFFQGLFSNPMVLLNQLRQRQPIKLFENALNIFGVHAFTSIVESGAHG